MNLSLIAIALLILVAFALRYWMISKARSTPSSLDRVHDYIEDTFQDETLELEGAKKIPSPLRQF